MSSDRINPFILDGDVIITFPGTLFSAKLLLQWLNGWSQLKTLPILRKFEYSMLWE